MSLIEKCKSINLIVDDYFRVNKSGTRIRACELFRENNGLKTLFSSAKTMRDVFRSLDEINALDAIPYLEKEDVGGGKRNWYFNRKNENND